MVRWELPGLEMPWYTPQTESSDSQPTGSGLLVIVVVDNA